MPKPAKNSNSKVPQHVAIIMDGNRRWARAHGLDATLGHQKMVDEGVEKVVKAAKKLGIKYLTLWAFSTENWDRSPREVKFLMKMFRRMFEVKAKDLHKEGVKIQAIGDISKFDQDIQEGIKKWTEESKKNKEIVVTLAVNYGGRDELLRAIQKISKDVKSGQLSTNKLSTAEFEKYLDTAGMPDPDLIIRTSGEQRLSGFLLWQNNYAELYFTKTLMPDFEEKELNKAVKEFANRQRRFGN